MIPHNTRALVVVISLVLIVSTVIVLFGFESLLDVRLTTDRLNTHALVFGIGLPRTGTCSLSKALSTLGRRVQHFPYKFFENQELYTQKFDAFTDLVMLGARPRQLVSLYPDALFIYTTRNDDEWVASIESLDKLLATYGNLMYTASVIRRTLRKRIGITREARLHFKHEYEREVAELQRRLGTSKVLTIDITSQHSDDLWHALSLFLGTKPIRPGKKFPRESEVRYHIKQFWRNTSSSVTQFLM